MKRFIKRYFRSSKSESRQLSQLNRRVEETPAADADSVPLSWHVIDLIRAQFDATYYLTTYRDVAAANIEPLEHYLEYGWREGRRPNKWFDPAAYMKSNSHIDPNLINPFAHFLETRKEYFDQKNRKHTLKENDRESILFYRPGINHDQFIGRPVQIKHPKKEQIELVRDFFDEEYYLNRYPDVIETGTDPIVHYLTIGWIEGRDPCPAFSTSYYLKKSADIARSGTNPLTHYLRYGRNEKFRATADVKSAEILRAFETSGMAQKIKEAKVLEPMVALPANIVRPLTSPQINAGKLAGIAKALRSDIGPRRFRYVVTVPHIRMSGAARAAMIFCRALAQIKSAKDILLVTTDSSELEFTTWLPKHIECFDLSSYLDHQTEPVRILCLIDLLRGVGAKAVFNINSRLMWDTMTLYGRQASQDFKIVTYMFTADANADGDRTGYPIQWLRNSADYHHLLLTDTQNLARDLSDRFGYSATSGTEALALYTGLAVEPADGLSPAIDVPEISTSRKTRSNRILWAGRFDRQKRIDILVEIARANPHLEFHAYGKPVLGNKGLDAYNAPGNLHEMGIYSNLAEVLPAGYAAFLHTSQWDGLPIIMLDIGLAGLPIIAPSVGGIPEIIDNENGWLIEDFTDIAAYSRALAEAFLNPTLAQEKARKLLSRIKVQFSEVQYVKRIEEALRTYDI